MMHYQKKLNRNPKTEEEIRQMIVMLSKKTVLNAIRERCPILEKIISGLLVVFIGIYFILSFLLVLPIIILCFGIKSCFLIYCYATKQDSEVAYDNTAAGRMLDQLFSRLHFISAVSLSFPIWLALIFMLANW